MKYFLVPLLLVAVSHHFGRTAADETHKTQAQLLKEAQEASDGVTARELISPGPPFLCPNGDPLHNASKWEYFETCTSVYDCEVVFGGYSARGDWCGSPNDDSNQCCVEPLCAAPYDSTQYSCVDLGKWPYCKEVVGGKELCPGPDSVRCCVGN